MAQVPGGKATPKSEWKTRRPARQAEGEAAEETEADATPKAHAMRALALLAALALAPLAAPAQAHSGEADTRSKAPPTPGTSTDATSRAVPRRWRGRGRTARARREQGWRAVRRTRWEAAAPTKVREGGDGDPRREGRPPRAQARARATRRPAGKNRKGSFQRPAETPPQINRNPQADGLRRPDDSGRRRSPSPQGRNYDAGPQHGAAGGVASGTGPASPGAAATAGTAGKAAEQSPTQKNKPGTQYRFHF